MAIQKKVPFGGGNDLQSVRREDAIITNVQSCHSCNIIMATRFQVALILWIKEPLKYLYQ
jgi:hypothetical protein